MRAAAAAAADREHGAGELYEGGRCGIPMEASSEMRVWIQRREWLG